MSLLILRLEDIRSVLVQLCAAQGVDPTSAQYLIEDYLGAELSGIRTHGLIKFLPLPRAVQARVGSPKIVSAQGCTFLVDAQRELGPVSARFCADLAIDQARQSGLAIVAMRNSARYGRLAPYAERITQAGLIALLSNQGGLAITPPGGITPVLGANPLCIGFPTGEAPLIIDFATSHAVWSEVLLASLEGSELRPELFYDQSGQFTTVPAAAYAVDSFGGAKGFGLALALEILCGALTGAKMGRQVKDEYDLGYLLIAVDPALWRSDAAGFMGEVSQLGQEIRDAVMRDPQMQARLPGDRAREERQRRDAVGTLSLHPQLWERLRAMAEVSPA